MNRRSVPWGGLALRGDADGTLALVLAAITLLVLAGCSAQTAVGAVAAGSLIAVELQQRLG
ncbi:hypothetical protein ABZZ46_34540 [Streptomyces rochei]|uniref:hypothetical protein n=1 Tax=Streptomyces rochei TaxID=1928 RepID=UPI0033A8BC23